MKNPAAYLRGRRDWRKNKEYRDNPYRHGTKSWQLWINGYWDAVDDSFSKLLK